MGTFNSLNCFGHMIYMMYEGITKYLTHPCSFKYLFKKQLKTDICNIQFCKLEVYHEGY